MEQSETPCSDEDSIRDNTATIQSILKYIHVHTTLPYSETSDSRPSKKGTQYKKTTLQGSLTAQGPKKCNPYSFNTLSTSEKRTTSLQRTRLVNLHCPQCSVSYRGWGALGFPTPSSAFSPQALLTLLYTLYNFPTPNGIRSSIYLF